MRIPAPDIDKLHAWIRSCADTLRLQAWRFEIHPTELLASEDGEDLSEPPVFGYISASISFDHEYLVGVLRLDPHYHHSTPEGLRHTIAHELTHILLARTADHLQTLTENLMGAGVISWAMSKITGDHESEVEHVSRLIETMLPLPKFKLNGPEE